MQNKKGLATGTILKKKKEKRRKGRNDGRNQKECFRHGTEARRNDITYREGAMQKKLLSFEQRFAPVDDCKKLLEKLQAA